MAFKPLKDQGYYFVAKHSGKVLGFKKNQNEDYDILQMDFDPNNELQRFRFRTLDINSDDKGVNKIMCPADQRCIYNAATEGFRMGLHQLSNEDHEHVVMRKLDAIDSILPSFSYDFRVEAAGDGYYRIKLIQNGKYLDVQMASVATDALVVQHQLMGSDNQLFWLIPATEKPNLSEESFKKSDTMIRDGALGLIGGLESVTKTKGVLKFLVGAFWEQEDDLSDLWEKMKVYVDVRIRELIEEDRLERLKSLIGGIMKIVHSISTRRSENPQGPDLDKILNTLTLLEGEYINSKSSKIFPYVIALGIITISLKHALLVEYELFYKAKPTTDELLDRLKDLDETVDQYIKVATKTKESLLSKRAEYFKSEEEKGMLSIVNKLYTDDFTGWKMVWEYKDPRSKDYSRSDKLFDAYKKRTSQQFATEVDEYMLSSKVFKYFKPKISENEHASAEELIRVYTADYAAKEEAYKKRALLSEVKVEIGSFGGVTATNKFVAEKGKITGISIFLSSPSQLCGIEVFYDKKSSGVKGLEVKSERYDLEDDDYIISVTGFGTERIDGLWFQTRKGKTFGGGSTNTAYFNADISDGLKPKLTGISGGYSLNSIFGGIEQLSFEWTYIDY